MMVVDGREPGTNDCRGWILQSLFRKLQKKHQAEFSRIRCLAAIQAVLGTMIPNLFQRAQRFLRNHAGHGSQVLQRLADGIDARRVA